MTVYEPLPGEFFVERSDGWAGRLIRVGTDSDVNHAGTYLGNGVALEAEPHGAVLGHMSPERIARVLWSGINPDLRLSAVEARDVCEHAMGHVGDPYSWLDVAAIGLTKVTGSHVPGIVQARLADPHRNMCSQLVDVVRMVAGVHLFADGRYPGAVSPGDLRALISSTP